MTIRDQFELNNTRVKLADLERRCEELKHGTEEDSRIQELSLRSLRRLVNRLKEEIVRYEIGTGSKK